MSKTVAYVLATLLLVPSAAWQAHVGVTLWRWFAEPLGAPHVGVARMMGLGVIISMYRYAGQTNRDDEDEKTGGQIFSAFIGRAFGVPLMGLFFGWLYTHLL